MPRSRRALLGGVATATTAAVAGCSFLQRSDQRPVAAPASTSWPTAHGGGARTGRNAVPDVAAEPSRRWPDHVGRDVEDAVFATDGTAFVLHFAGLTAVNPDGSQRWQTDVDYYGPLLLTRDALVVQRRRGGMAGFDRDSGERRWTTAGWDPYALADGRLVTSPESAAVGAVDADGGVEWNRDRPAERFDFQAAVVATDDLVVVPYVNYFRPHPGADYESARSALVAYDAASGGTLWRTDLPGSVDRVAVGDDFVHAGTHVRDGESSTVAALQYALAADSGHVRSRRSLPDPTFDGLVVDADAVYSAAGTTLRAFDPRLGGPRWEASLPTRVTSLAASDSLLYATWSAYEPWSASGELVVAAFETATGDPAWRRTVPTDWGYVAGVTDGRLYVQGAGETGLFALA